MKKRGVRARTYTIMAEAVEAGIARGFRRAHKHTSKPAESALLDEIEQAVMAEICERFEFDGV